MNQTRLEVSAALTAQVTGNRRSWQSSVNDVYWVLYAVHRHDDFIVTVEAFNSVTLRDPDHGTPRLNTSFQSCLPSPVPLSLTVIDLCRFFGRACLKVLLQHVPVRSCERVWIKHSAEINVESAWAAYAATARG